MSISSYPDTIGALPERLPYPSPYAVEHLLEQLTRTERPADRAVLIESCAALLRQAPRIDRLHHLCSWALARDPRVRRVAAAVLADDVLQVGASSILEHLGRDRDERVRLEVAITARAVAPARPVPNGALVRKLASDSSGAVRAAATGGQHDED